MTLSKLQSAVLDWAFRCFGKDIAMNEKERSLRFLEEALELVQACGLTNGEAIAVTDYVYARPIGEKSQEVAGVLISLSALANGHGIDMEHEAEKELNRCQLNINKIREKNRAKPFAMRGYLT